MSFKFELRERIRQWLKRPEFHTPGLDQVAPFEGLVRGELDRVQVENHAWAARNFYGKEFRDVAEKIVALPLPGGDMTDPRDIESMRVRQVQDVLFEELGHLMPFLGMVEELGELAHAILKQRQGIRTGEDHEAAARDAYADLRIYGVDFCNRMAWKDSEVVAATWDGVVKKRDWVADPEHGRRTVETVETETVTTVVKG